MSFIIKVLGEPLLFFFLDPFSKMNKPFKNHPRDSLLSERLLRDSKQMGWPFLREPTKYEPGLSRQEASLNMVSNQAVGPAV
jgi:hypothetical protein